METRKITIVSTKSQSKKVIMSSATTLAELKSDLRQNGIDYEGMSFFEGTSKVELKMMLLFFLMMYLGRALLPMNWYSCSPILTRKLGLVQ